MLPGHCLAPIHGLLSTQRHVSACVCVCVCVCRGMRVRGRFSKTIAFQRQILKEGKARINARKKMYQQLEKALARGDEEVCSVSGLSRGSLSAGLSV